ncbi:hypothetical protein SDC9_155462 [bioreactor metagenome]|uniref:Uncharacterized protein n=1 Tax=bioreactor metagenome TaxID=1076179 RepID=A0A645F1M3_9ZZZZ
MLLDLLFVVRYQDFRFQNTKRANAAVAAVRVVVVQRAVRIDVPDVVISRAVRRCQPPPFLQLRNYASKATVHFASKKPDPRPILPVVFQPVVSRKIKRHCSERFFRRARVYHLLHKFAVEIGAKGRGGEIILVPFVEGAFLQHVRG